MKSQFKPRRLFTNLLRNYQAPAVFCLIAAISYALLGFFPYSDEHPTLYRLFGSAGMASLLAVALSTVCCAFRSRLRHSFLLSWIAAIVGLSLKLLFPNENDRLIGILLACVALCFWGACGKERPIVRLNQILGWFFACLGLSMVLFLALIFIQGAVTTLFAESAANGLINLILSFCFLLFAPWMFLGGLPDDETPADTRTGFSKFCARVLLPLFLLLMAVLLLYVLKILLTWKMPVGKMNSYALTALGCFTFFHLTLDGSENKLTAWFIKWGGYMMLPVLIAQQVGVWIRVEAYGLTEARILGMGFTLVCLTAVIASLFRKRANWFFPAAAIAVLAMIVSPLNAGDFARMQQEARLEDALRRNNMLNAAGEIVANSDADIEDRTIIYDAANYLIHLDASENSLAKQMQQRMTTDDRIQYYDTELWYQLFGFNQPVKNSRKSFFFTFEGSATHNELSVQGYDHAKWYSSTCTIQEDTALVADLEACGTPFVFPHYPVVFSIDGEDVDLQSLLRQVTETTKPHELDRTFTLNEDTILLPSGRILHIASLRISHYSSTNISLNGWVLTPEAE